VHDPGAQVAFILGLTDFFGIASTIALEQGRSRKLWQLSQAIARRRLSF
jgi:hypothetical protein